MIILSHLTKFVKMAECTKISNLRQQYLQKSLS